MSENGVYPQKSREKHDEALPTFEKAYFQRCGWRFTQELGSRACYCDSSCGFFRDQTRWLLDAIGILMIFFSITKMAFWFPFSGEALQIAIARCFLVPILAAMRPSTGP
jgi:hypothetical protein